MSEYTPMPDAANPPNAYERSLQDPNIFSITWELVPGRGASEKNQDNILVHAENAAKSGKVNALTITDNPGGSPALSAEMLGAEIRRLGIEPLVHLTCKDKNRSTLESLLYGLERARVNNLLVMTGDYPKDGYRGAPKPVFDLDPVTLLGLIGELNQGREIRTPKGTSKLKPTHFFPGVAANPFKATEAEQVTQYFKLKKKLHAGARFIVSQLGYDARKFHELLLIVRLFGYGHVPVVGNIYVMSAGAARVMNANGVPGCVVPDKLLAEIEREATAPDKGKARRIERAAKQYAVLKGLGFAGVHIAGNSMNCEDLERLIARGEELAQYWQELVREFNYPKENGWYYFGRDDATGLNTEAPAVSEEKGSAGFAYQLFRLVHAAAFEKPGLLFGPMRAISKALDGTKLERPFTKAEQIVKEITNNCRHCGDCALLDTAYLCPMSQCAKNQRNGPCGGSRDGFCEKFPNEKKCIYVRAYERLRTHHTEEDLASGVTPPVNHELNDSSSWMNFYLGRDHSASKCGIEKVERKKPI